MENWMYFAQVVLALLGIKLYDYLKERNKYKWRFSCIKCGFTSKATHQDIILDMAKAHSLIHEKEN